MKGVVSVLLLLAVAHSAVERAHSLTCNGLKTTFAPCLPFIIGGEAQPSGECCNSLSSFVSKMRSTEDKRSACKCLKDSAVQLPIIVDKVTALCSKCGAALPFPVTNDMDCDKIE